MSPGTLNVGAIDHSHFFSFFISTMFIPESSHRGVKTTILDHHGCKTADITCNDEGRRKKNTLGSQVAMFKKM